MFQLNFFLQWPVLQGQGQRIRKVAVAYFLSHIEEKLTTNVRRPFFTGYGVHLMLFTTTNGLNAVREEEHHDTLYDNPSNE